MPHATVQQTLHQVQLFSDLSETELRYLSERAVPRHFAPGELVFSEGDACTGLFVVESGKVRIFKSSPSGREQVLAVEGPPSSIAELPVFDGGKFPASVAAIEESTLLFISRQDFHSLCLVHPQVALKVLRVVGKRLRGLVGIIEELSFTTVRARLISFLLRLARQQGRKTEHGTEIALPSSNQEVATHIGTVRELVSRNMSRLQAEGLIRIDGRNVTILDVEGLRSQLSGEEG